MQQALAELEDAGLNANQVNVLWDLYTEARKLQEEWSGGAPGNGDPTQQAGPTQNTQASRAGMFALGVLSRLLTVLQLMYSVSQKLDECCCMLLLACRHVADMLQRDTHMAWSIIAQLLPWLSLSKHPPIQNMYIAIIIIVRATQNSPSALLFLRMTHVMSTTIAWQFKSGSSRLTSLKVGAEAAMPGKCLYVSGLLATPADHIYISSLKNILMLLLQTAPRSYTAAQAPEPAQICPALHLCSHILSISSMPGTVCQSLTCHAGPLSTMRIQAAPNGQCRSVFGVSIQLFLSRHSQLVQIVSY